MSEILLIFVIVLVVFGPQRLPDIARQIGRALGELRRVGSRFEDEVRGIVDLDGGTDFPYMRAPGHSDAETAGTGPTVAPTAPARGEPDGEAEPGAEPPRNPAS